MNKPKYITQIDGKWLDDVSSAVNLRAGNLIKVEKKNGETIVSVDENALKMALWFFLRNATSTTVWRCNFSELPLIRLDQDM